ATPLETLQQVQQQEPRRPRSLNRKVDRDLETICLKCLSKDPRQRYRSAEALADDLERWLAHKPIHARPHSLAGRGIKWGRRHPRTTVLLGLAAVLVLAGAAWKMWQWDQQRLKVRYYTNCVLRQGVLEGVGPVSERQARWRSDSFRFQVRAGRVE